jgi:competence protein ComEC
VSRTRAVPDLRLLAPVLAGWASARLGLTLRPVETLAVAAFIGLVGAVALWRGGSGTLVTAGATALVSAALATSAALHVYASQLGPVPALAAAQGRATVSATVTGDPKPAKHVVLLPVRIDELEDTGAGPVGVRTRATVLAFPRTPQDLARWMDLVPSEHVRLAARFGPPDDPASGDTATLTVDRPPLLLGGPDLVQRAAAVLRTDLRQAVSGLPAEPAGVLPALTLGDTRAVPAQTVADLKTAGLSYLVVVSGDNS